MNNLKKFATEAEYSAATLNYPAVSWITANDSIHFDKSAPTPSNDKIMMAWRSPSDAPSGKDIALWNAAVSLPPTELFNSLTINNVDVMGTIGSDGTLENYSTPGTVYLVKYDLTNDTTITDIFNGDLGGGWGSGAQNIDFLIPSQVTEIQSLPQNVGNLVVEVATPPTASFDWSAFRGTVYVPDNALSVYQTACPAHVTVLPISEYQGLLPV